MKYLKLFKEGSKDDYYIKIDGSSFTKYFINRIDSKPQTLNYISKLFKRKWSIFSPNWVVSTNINYVNKTLYVDIKNNKIKKYINSNITPTEDRVYAAMVYELEDEYFIVTLYSLRSGQKIYRCDQLDGVKELFEDLKII